MIPALIALALQAAPAPPDPCQVDRAAILALSQEAFDQDLARGWRPLAQRPGCEGAAADLVRDYRASTESRIHILYWHEGQLRANIGEYPEAIRLMEQSRRLDDPFGWNPYVDATIAFLHADLGALNAARARLATLPRPSAFREQVLANGYRLSWPPNLEVVDALVRCFGRPYREAYGSPPCRTPPRPERTSR